MKLNVKELVSLDVYRDGGSLSVSFTDEDKAEIMLFFKVNRVANEPKNSEDVSYNVPVVIKSPKGFISEVLGVGSNKRKIEEVITWVEALNILKMLESQIECFESEYLWVYGKMLEIAHDEGR